MEKKGFLSRIKGGRKADAPEVLDQEQRDELDLLKSKPLSERATNPVDVEFNSVADSSAVDQLEEGLEDIPTSAGVGALHSDLGKSEATDELEDLDAIKDAEDNPEVLDFAADLSKTKKKKKSFFGRKAKGNGKKESKKGSGSEELPTSKRHHGALPIRVMVGFLPEVSGRDARDYALGVAERHFDQPAIAYYDAFKYESGFAYEVHEGGEGVAYLPEILKYFQSLETFRPGEDHKVVILTGSRKVQVSRTSSGISAILLPESSSVEETPWLEPKQKMAPALNQRTGLLVAGAVFFVTGFFSVILASSLTRIQPVDPPIPPGVESIAYENLPISQWGRLTSLANNYQYVVKLEYKDGEWAKPETKSPEPEEVEPNEEELVGFEQGELNSPSNDSPIEEAAVDADSDLAIAPLAAVEGEIPLAQLDRLTAEDSDPIADLDKRLTPPKD